MRVCGRCKYYKPESDYYTGRSLCKKCISKDQKKRRLLGCPDRVCITCKKTLRGGLFFGNSKTCHNCITKNQKRCRLCNRVKRIELFHNHNGTLCKVCHNKDTLKHWHSMTVRAKMQSRLHFKYGITPDEFRRARANTPNCPLCDKVFHWDSLTQDTPLWNQPSIDHIIPGRKDWWIICRRCNTVKNDVSLQEAQHYAKVDFWRRVSDKMSKHV